MKEREEVFYRLTEEGMEYAERGLPERRALNMLKERACSIEDLKASLGEREAKIAVNWLLKKGWARIERKQGKEHARCERSRAEKRGGSGGGGVEIPTKRHCFRGSGA
nr:hypothetical protein [Methanophagales archaeon]